MKKELFLALPEVHESQIGRYGQEDPSTPIAVPAGEYTLVNKVVQAPAIVKGGNTWAAIGFMVGDSIYPVGLRKFRGYGTIGGVTTTVVTQPAIKGGLTAFLKTNPKVRVVKTETVSVDRYQEDGVVNSNYPIWEIVAP
jgi:hypothetical protein